MLIEQKQEVHGWLSSPNVLPILMKMIRNGILKDPTIIRHLQIIDEFKAMDTDIPKMERYERLADRWHMNPKHLQQTILKLTKTLR